MGDLKTDLAPGRELIETHISWVFREADTVLKVKKPVNLGFLDFSTRELRLGACEQEIRLNRRLSEGVYRDVVPITVGPDGIHRIAGEGEPVDHAVRMNRLSDADRADRRLGEGRLSRGAVQRIAHRLAAFHDGAERSAHIETFGDIDTIRRNVTENFEQARALSARFITTQQERDIERSQLGFIERHRALFRQRVRDGRIRDGHGDLRLEHVYLSNGRLNIIDCIEFNERFRYGDVCADLAFLAMDLVHRERSDFAEDLLAAYARSSADYDLYSLIDFYQGYRAYVRAKVASFLAGDTAAAGEARAAAEQSARGYYLHALSAQRAPLAQPKLIAVGGLIAAGKSHTAERLSELMHCPVIDSDRTRKQLAGVGPRDRLTEPPFAGAYAPESSQRVYAELLRRADVVLASGRVAIVDASFRLARDRLAARDVARRQGVEFHFVECTVPRAVAMERLRARAGDPGVSDGRAEIYDDFAVRWEPVAELAAGERHELETVADDQAFRARLCSLFGGDF